MDELQIIDEILNQIYGYNTIFKGDDEELIKKKKKEKDEKQEEMINQINLMCTMLEKELRNELGEAFFEVKKGLRTFVIDTIQKEVKNGNKIIDSNGKISLKKFSTQILAHKNEIINEKNSNKTNMKEENVFEANLESKEKTFNDEFDVKEFLNQKGIELSEEEEKAIEMAVNNADRLYNEFLKRKAEGKTDQEVIQEMINEYSAEEIDAFMNDMRLAAAYETLKILSVENEQIAENDLAEPESMEQESITPEPESMEQEPITPEPGSMMQESIMPEPGTMMQESIMPEPTPMAQEPIMPKLTPIAQEPIIPGQIPISPKKISTSRARGTLTSVKTNNGTIKCGNPRKISEWKERAMFFEKFYTVCRDKDGKGEKKVLYDYKKIGLIDAETPVFLSAGNKIHGVIQEIANNMDYSNSDKFISEGKRELINGYLDTFPVKIDKERRDLIEAITKQHESSGEEIVVSPIDINVPTTPETKGKIQAEKLIYQKNIAAVINKNQEDSSKTIGKSILELSGVKDYIQNNATEWQIRHVTEALTQAGKEVDTLEKNSTENKQQDQTESQTTEPGPGEPDDEVK